MNSTIRYASHAGSWYDDDPKALARELSNYLSQAKKIEQFQSLKSIIVPHSGLEYGGPIAAKAFINVNPQNYNRVVILGPSHYEYFNGCGLTPFEKYSTPFGDVNVDTETINKLLGDTKNFIKLSNSVDVKEHSIEMEMPFLKYIFDKQNFSIIPMIIGEANLRKNTQIGQCIYDLYEDPKTLFVISSDFCHWGNDFDYVYYNKKFKNIWESTQDLDRQALDIIGEMDSKKFDEYFKRTNNTICGRNPITIVLSIIEKYKEMHKDKKISFDTAGYSQSEKVKTIYDSSVSYAAGVNFIM